MQNGKPESKLDLSKIDVYKAKQSRDSIQDMHRPQKEKENKFRNVQFGSILVHINVTQIDINQVEEEKQKFTKKRYMKIDA